MIALIDILGKSKDPEEAIIIFVLFVVVAVVIAVVKAVQKQRQALAKQPMRARKQAWTPPAQPQRVAAPPAITAPSSASHNDVAAQLAPEMVTMANARNLTPQVATVAARKVPVGSWLKSTNDVRRALVLNEILGKPLSMRRR